VIAYCLAGLAELAMIEQDAARAATMLGASGGLFSEIGATLSPDEAQTQERITAYILAELGDERADELRVAGAAIPLDELLDDVASRS
jgi:hypothetical protein